MSTEAHTALLTPKYYQIKDWNVKFFYKFFFFKCEVQGTYFKNLEDIETTPYPQKEKQQETLIMEKQDELL